MRLRFAAVCLAVLAASAITVAQQRPVFRAEANYVEVDAVVTDQQGHFVTGLTPADFVLREAYKPQRIDIVDYVNLPTKGSRGATGPTSDVRIKSGLGIESSDLSRRIYLLYLNVPSPQSLIETGQQARQFIEDFVEPGDMVGLWSSDAISQTLTFTTDKREMLKALPPLGHLAAGSGLSGREIGKLDDAVEFLSGIQGRRKALILFSAGWPSTTYGPWGTNAAASIPWTGVGGPAVTPVGRIMSPFWDTPSDITGMADVQIYTVDSRGLAAPPLWARTHEQLSAGLDAMTSSTDMLRSIADETGGLAVFNTNDYRAGFARIVEDNSRYYVLGYSSAIKDRNHRFIAIDLRSARPGLTVRARKGYFTR